MQATNELWASPEWIETDYDKHPWMKRNREEMYNHSPRRWFVIEGTQWPLICVSVYKDYPMEPMGIRVAVSMKQEPNGWFSDCNLPFALAPVLIEMLNGVLI